MSDQEYFFPFLLPSLTVFSCFLHHEHLYDSSVHLFALFRQIKSIVHVPQALGKGGNLNSTQLLGLPRCLWFCSSAHPRFLLDFQCLSFSGGKLGLLYYVRVPGPGDPFPSLWLTTPDPGDFASRLCVPRKGHKARVTRIKLPVQSTDLQFYWPAWLSPFKFWPIDGAVTTTTCCTWIETLGKLSQASWFKLTPSTASSLTYLILIGLGLGDHGSKVHSRHWELSCL